MFHIIPSCLDYLKPPADAELRKNFYEIIPELANLNVMVFEDKIDIDLDKPIYKGKMNAFYFEREIEYKRLMKICGIDEIRFDSHTECVRYTYWNGGITGLFLDYREKGYLFTRDKKPYHSELVNNTDFKSIGRKAHVVQLSKIDKGWFVYLTNTRY